MFRIIASCFVLMLAVFLFLPSLSYAEEPVTGSEIQKSLDITGEATSLSKTDPRIIAGRVIKAALSIVGAIALCIVIYAGFLYMTAGGDPDKIKKAKQWLTNAFIGLVIIFMAYSIVSYIINQLLGAGEEGLGIQGGLPESGYGLSSGAFGDVIQSHFPTPDQIGVPRNTMILVTFKKSINPDSIMDQKKKNLCPPGLNPKIPCGEIKKTVKLYRCDLMPGFPANQAADKCLNVKIQDPTDDKLVSGFAVMTEDHRTIVFNPFGNTDTHLGSGTENVSYIVHLMPGIEKEGGTKPISVFPKSYPDYKWRFTTSTLIDTTPPQIDYVIPGRDAGVDPKVEDDSLCDPKKDADCPEPKVYRNQLVIVNFNEPVIPPLTQTQTCEIGDADNEAQLKLLANKKLADCKTSHIPGGWKVGINNYQTIQFVPSTSCEGIDINSCGEKVFCLPKDADLRDKVLAAELSGGISMFGTGIMDVAGNSLDGNANGKTEGPGQSEEAPLDSYIADFATGNAIDLKPPIINSLNPANGSESVEVSVPIKAYFNKTLEPSSVDSEIALLGEDFTGWYDPNFDKKEVDDGKGGKKNTIDLKTVNMTHGPFAYVGPDEAGEGPLYAPIIPSRVRDSRQNCFTPARAEVDPSIPGATIGSGGDNCTTGKINQKAYGTSCCANKDNLAMEKKTDKPQCELPGKIKR